MTTRIRKVGPGYKIDEIVTRDGLYITLPGFYSRKQSAEFARRFFNKHGVLPSATQIPKFKKNPAHRAKKTRIHRPSIRLAAYVTHPSQITRKKPSKRLVKRRRKVQARPAKGYFPNPKGVKVLIVETKHGKEWKKRVMYDARKFAHPSNMAFGAARVYAKIERVPARVIVRYVDSVKQAITNFA